VEGLRARNVLEACDRRWKLTRATMADFIKITPVNTGRVEMTAMSLITFDTGARTLVYETIDEIVATTR
jgi:hypothetical protein